MTSSADSTRARVVETIAEIAQIEPSRVLGALRLREDLGMDSLGSLELLSTIAEHLRIDIEMEEAMDLVTVDDACAFVERRRAERLGVLQHA
jgi:acyl carrier protein